MHKILAKSFFVGKKIVYMPSCRSTNEVASDLLKNGEVEEGTIVITDHQRSGRGQRGNHWESEEGKNITCSLVLKPDRLPVADQFVLNVIVSLGVAEAVEDVLSMDVKVKWPNDIYCNGEKISGILINNTVKSNMLESAIVGVGLNVNQQHFSCFKATSLSVLSGNTTYDLSQILESVVLSIEKRYFQWENNRESLWEDYLAKMYWLGEVRTYKSEKEYFSGIIRGVTKSGRLQIKQEKCTREFAFKTIVFVR